jgi:hypothetical protein
MNTANHSARQFALGSRNLVINVVIYLVMNALFVITWLPNNGMPLPEGFFWPAIPIVAWGAGLAIYARTLYRRSHRTDG